MTQQTENTEHGAETTEHGLLDLAASERFVTLRIAGREARHIFRPLTLEDWAEYMKAAAGELVSQGDVWTSESEADAAAAALWEKSIVSVEGYKMAPFDSAQGEIGPGPISAVSDQLKERIPLGHKTAAVGLLQEVYVAESPDPFDLEADVITVALEAAWNGVVYDRLLHRLRMPTQQEAIDYRRLNVQYYRKRGARNQATRIRIPSRLRPVCQLYDKLLVSIEGYTPAEPKLVCPLQKLAVVGQLMEGHSRSSQEAAET